MSLLMEALKKAERAKQEHTIPHEPDSGLVAGRSPLGQTGQPGGDQVAQNPPEASDMELTLLAREQVTAESPDAGSKSEYPPIDATPAEPEPPAAPDATPEIGLQPDTPFEPDASGPRQQMPHSGTRKAPAEERKTSDKRVSRDGQITAAQQTARTVFTAKHPTRSRTLLLASAATAAVVGLAAFGIYYWRIASTGTMTLPPAPPQAAMPAPPSPALASAPPGNIPHPQPGMFQGTTGPASGPEKNPTPAAPAAYDSARASTLESTRARSGSESLGEAPAIRIRHSTASSQLNPSLGKAYQAFLSGDIETAQQQYHKVLQQEPNNRDALLGMAAIALNRGQAGQAAAYYTELLELDPADPDALAGLVGLQGQADPVQSETRLKKILAQNPQAAAVHFALGNVYTQQSRWAEAQQSYFRAYSSQPGNADYAFNLAVSLDTLNQGKLAQEYYQRALALAQSGPANFDKSSVRNRIKELLQAAN